MLEINEHTRLVKHGGHQWMAQQLVESASSYRREIWKPITKLLNNAETEHWLNSTQAPDGVIAEFRAANARIQ